MSDFNLHSEQGDDQWGERTQSLDSLDGNNQLYTTFLLELDFTTSDATAVDEAEEDAPISFQEHWELEYTISKISITFEEEPDPLEDEDTGQPRLCWKGELHLTIEVDDDSEDSRAVISDAILAMDLPDDMVISLIN